MADSAPPAASPAPSSPTPTMAGNSTATPSAPADSSSAPVADNFTATPSPSADSSSAPVAASTAADKAAPANNPRPAHGPPARAITKAQLQRGRRSICTQCKHAQSVSSNLSMFPDRCPCPWARRPSPHPGWGWRWIGSQPGYFGRTAERRAQRRLCFVCRLALTVGPHHPTCPPWFPCPWASPPWVDLPPDRAGNVVTVDWEERQRRLSEERGAAETRTAPRCIQVQMWPDANGERGLRWIDVNQPQPPEWWEPHLLGPLPLRRRF